MTESLEDKSEIATLMSGWLHRDLSQWDALAALFHPEATIEITWFRGPAADFVRRSKAMGASALTTRHFIGMPQLTFSGTKALAETPAIIVIQNHALGLGATTHSRFLDRVEQRDGGWRILERHCSYDISTIDFPRGPVVLDRQKLDRHPFEYAPLAYLLESGGFPVDGKFPTRGSTLETTLKNHARNWLTA